MPTDQDIIIAVASERLANRKNEKSWKYRFRDYDIVDLRSGTPDAGGNGPKIHIAPEDLDKCAKTEDDLISALGRKWKTIIPSLGQFCSYCRGHTHDGCLPLPNGGQFTFRQIAIACTNKMLCSMFGHPRKVNRLIGKALETGLLVRLTQTYRFGSRNKEYNHSYLYAYNGTVEGLIRATCRNHKITIPLIVANMEESTALLLTGGRTKGNGICRNPEDGMGEIQQHQFPH